MTETQHGCGRTDTHHHHEAQTGPTYADNGPSWKCPTPWAAQSPCPGPVMSGYDSLEDVFRWVCPECGPNVSHGRIVIWSPELLEYNVELHEYLYHGIQRANA